jgi:hypothetical protein
MSIQEGHHPPRDGGAYDRVHASAVEDARVPTCEPIDRSVGVCRGLSGPKGPDAIPRDPHPAAADVGPAKQYYEQDGPNLTRLADAQEQLRDLARRILLEVKIGTGSAEPPKAPQPSRRFSKGKP